jgi:hypothetical protein
MKKNRDGTGNCFCSPKGISFSFDLGYLDGGHVFGIVVDSGDARAMETKPPDLVTKLEGGMSKEAFSIIIT